MSSERRKKRWLAPFLAMSVLAACSRPGVAEPQPEFNAAVSPAVTTVPAVDDVIPGWCEKVTAAIRGFKWQTNVCKGIEWKVGGTSVKGMPLVYAEFGNPKSQNTTLVLAMVHGDEITPLYLGLELASWLRDHSLSLGDARIIIAPLVNPDGFFVKPRTRVNANGVDCNRNFLTADWKAKALKAWKTRFRSEPRRFPGHTPNSEPETLFQKDLIGRFRPQKILSVHAPLNFTDYDGPTPLSLARFPRDYVRECLKLRKHLRAISGGFFPGSLGNFAGQELGIPTITLELPTADPRKARAYWLKFEKGIRGMLEFKVSAYAARIKWPSDG